MIVPLVEPKAQASSWFTFEDEIGEELLRNLAQLTGPHIMDHTVQVTVHALPRRRSRAQEPR